MMCYCTCLFLGPSEFPCLTVAVPAVISSGKAAYNDWQLGMCGRISRRGRKCQGEASRSEGRAVAGVTGDNYLTRKLCPGLVLRTVNNSEIMKEVN